MAHIPKPPKQIKVSPDKRMEYLLEWKRLFEAISPQVKVYLNDSERKDKSFRLVFEKCLGKYFRGFYYNQADIIVIVGSPGHDRLWYLIGCDNKMFSNFEVEKQVVDQEEHDDSLFWPETKQWRQWYKVVCDQYNQLHRSIPVPPTEKQGTDT
ncbi:MAG: hypothetical protein QG654_69 [Patescibacteria group bacterium]|nr:hypothetical protein [Patescibacteria group bacterium]